MNNKNKVWITSKKYKGVRYYFHDTRKHGVKFDRMFSIRYQLDGKEYRNNVGWASEGWTEERASAEISKFKENHRLGKEVFSLTEARKVANEKRKAKELLQKEEEKKHIAVSKFWSERYWLAQQHKSQGTLRAEKALFEHWLSPIIGDKALIHVNQTDFETIKNNLIKAKKSPATISHAFGLFSQIWNMAKADGIVERDCPAKKKGLPKKDNRRERFLTEEESELLLANLKLISLQTHDISLLSLYTGMRFGEIANLEWSSIDIESRTISIRDPKSRRNRKAYLLERTIIMLEERRKLLLEAGKPTKGLVFPSTTGEIMATISKTFGRTADKLFNQDVTDRRQKVCFHTLRHTFASWLVQRGTDLYKVKELMGHADISMTQRYSHLSPEGLRRAIEVLG